MKRFFHKIERERLSPIGKSLTVMAENTGVTMGTTSSTSWLWSKEAHYALSQKRGIQIVNAHLYESGLVIVTLDTRYQIPGLGWSLWTAKICLISHGNISLVHTFYTYTSDFIIEYQYSTKCFMLYVMDTVYHSVLLKFYNCALFQMYLMN